MSASYDQDSPLLHTQQVAADPAQTTKGRAFAGVLGILALTAVAGVVHTKKASTSSTVLTTGYQKTPTDVLMYKRTTPTSLPYEDCKFLTKIMGFSCSADTITPSLTNEEGFCGERATGLAGQFCLHEIKDDFYPSGDSEVWSKKIVDAHKDSFGDFDSKFDAFMTLGTGYYTPYLAPHLARWVGEGQPFRAHTYTNPADTLPMFVLLTYNPNTGHVFEVHGKALDDDAETNAALIAKHFSEAPEDACVLALSTGQEVAHLDADYASSVADYLSQGADGLPFAMMAKVSHPTLDRDAVASWMKSNAALDLEKLESESLSDDGSDDSADDASGKSKKLGACKVASVSLSKYQDAGHASLMFVEDARKSESSEKAFSVKSEVWEFISHVEKVHVTHMGTQRGWDRWMDNHVGLVYQGVHLDDIAPTLVQNSVGFHAFRDVYKEDKACSASSNEAYCGSIWTTGHSGLGIEMKAFFDPSKAFFNGEFAPTYMDFCDHKSNEGTKDMFDDDQAMDDWR